MAMSRAQWTAQNRAAGGGASEQGWQAFQRGRQPYGAQPQPYGAQPQQPAGAPPPQPAYGAPQGQAPQQGGPQNLANIQVPQNIQAIPGGIGQYRRMISQGMAPDAATRTVLRAAGLPHDVEGEGYADVSRPGVVNQYRDWEEKGLYAGSDVGGPCPPNAPYHPDPDHMKRWFPQAAAQMTGQECVEKPFDVPENLKNAGGGGAGGPGGGPGGGGGGGAGGGQGGVPQFRYGDFSAPSYEDAAQDPGYQFARDQGLEALQRRAGAAGGARGGNVDRAMVDYATGLAQQQYGDVYNRAAGTYDINRQTAAMRFEPQYGGWQTQYGGNLAKWQSRYGGDLQRDLLKENQIYNLLSAAPPGYGGGY